MVGLSLLSRKQGLREVTDLPGTHMDEDKGQGLTPEP